MDTTNACTIHSKDEILLHTVKNNRETQELSMTFVDGKLVMSCLEVKQPHPIILRNCWEELHSGFNSELPHICLRIHMTREIYAQYLLSYPYCSYERIHTGDLRSRHFKKYLPIQQLKHCVNYKFLPIQITLVIWRYFIRAQPLEKVQLEIFLYDATSIVTDTFLLINM